jgi:phage FluMu protein Com
VSFSDPAPGPQEDVQPRCVGQRPDDASKACGKLLAEWVTRPWAIRCPRCKALNSGVVDHVAPVIDEATADQTQPSPS